MATEQSKRAGRKALNQCCAAIFFVSQKWIDSGGCEEESSQAIQQRTECKDFQIIALNIDGCEPPKFLRATKCINAAHYQLDLDIYQELLKVFYEDDIDLELENPKDIFLSRTWKDSESPLADYVYQKLLHPGIRLIGDSTDNPSFGEDRIRRIIASCGGLLAILPFRGEGGALLIVA